MIIKQMDAYEKLHKWERTWVQRKEVMQKKNLLDFFDRMSSVFDERDGCVNCVLMDC